MNVHPAFRFLMPIVIAVVLGPLVAGLAVCLLALVTNISDRFSGIGSLALSDFPGLFLAYVTFAYVIGAPIALLAGLFVSLWMIRRVPNVLVVTVAAVLATGLFIGVAALGLLGPVQETNGRSNLLFTLVFAVIGALGCWLLIRRFLGTRTNDALTRAAEQKGQH